MNTITTCTHNNACLHNNTCLHIQYLVYRKLSENIYHFLICRLNNFLLFLIKDEINKNNDNFSY